MPRKDTIIKLSEYENQILDLVIESKYSNNHFDMTRSDLQGVVQAIVLNIYQEGIACKNTE